MSAKKLLHFPIRSAIIGPRGGKAGEPRAGAFSRAQPRNGGKKSMETKGNISIHAQNIMPVIKRWLYSDKDIFIREMVSNGCDAITKYKMLRGDTGEDLRVTVTVDKNAGEMRFTDNGIGMTAEEVEKYINQVAFSSAEEFLKNYTGGDQGGIIGHFGLGF